MPLCKSHVTCPTILAAVFLVVAIGLAVVAIVYDELSVNLGSIDAVCGYKEVRFEDKYDDYYTYRDLCKDSDDKDSKECGTYRTGLLCYYGTIAATAFVLFNTLLLLCGLKRIGSCLGFMATIGFVMVIASWLGTDEDFDNKGNKYCFTFRAYDNEDIDFGVSFILTCIAAICTFIGSLLSCVKGEKKDDDDYHMTQQHSSHASNGVFGTHV